VTITKVKTPGVSPVIRKGTKREKRFTQDPRRAVGGHPKTKNKRETRLGSIIRRRLLWDLSGGMRNSKEGKTSVKQRH